MATKLTKWLALLILLPVAVLADVITIKEDAPEVYVVKKGDTLWDISNMYLEQAWLWPELWRNNVHISNPHLIYPGDELRFSYNDQGEPVMEIAREESEPVIEEPEPMTEEPEVVEQEVAQVPPPVKKRLTLSPEGVRTAKAPQPIGLLPWEVIAPYVNRDQVMSPQEYERLPYLLGNHDGGVRFATGDVVLSKSTRRGGEKHRIIRKRNEIKDADGNVLGILVRHVADANNIKADLEGQWLVQVEGANFEAKRGDKLVPWEAQDQQPIELSPATEQRGQIVDSLEQHQLLGKFDVAVIDLGLDSVNPGTVFGIYSQGPAIMDSEEPLYEHENNYMRSAFSSGEEVQQPAVKVGEMVVFKVFDKTSYALITRSTHFIRHGSIIAQP